ncbi:MAG TPA: cupin domain-containing protein [Burkholderiaceae bacterium]|nr:cupin domain-containing protein [Burkholderiaceae bacterium]
MPAVIFKRISSLILALVAIVPLTHLGAMPVTQFMRTCWQKRPLLIRNALSGFMPPLEVSDLFRLAGREDVEARLVSNFGGWQLQHGPIARRRLPPLGKPGWTLLVQGVDQHDDHAAALLARFRFITDARLDDLMVSYASEGGGVGPHIDDYDVFLLQAQGRRRWRIGKGDADDLVPDAPLKVLRRFETQHDWVLDPGDLLYLPPRVAHWGTAVGGACLTCSIGFRAPAWQELLGPWFDALSTRVKDKARYADPGAPPTRRPAHLPAAFIDAAFAALARSAPTRADARDLLLAFLTEPKPNIVFTRAHRRLSQHDLRTQARRRGLQLDRRTRMLYSGRSIAINGELLDDARTDRTLMQALADQRSLAPAQLTGVAASSWHEFADWHHAGWLHLL